MATITSGGAVPDSPSDLRDKIIAAATALSPNLTANLPASLVEDLSSTGAGALVVQDQAYCDLINSIAPTTATEQILIQLGNTYGVARGIGSNTSVYVRFTGTVGFVINQGFIVSDGTHQYVTQTYTVIPTGGTTDLVYCLAVAEGSWAVPANTVTTISTSKPSGVTLTVTNPSAGTAGEAAQSLEDYRLQVIQAGKAIATGTPTFVRTQLERIDGVQARLISIRQTGSGWSIICGGGDPYEVANGIYQSVFNIDALSGYSGAGTTITKSLLDFPNTYTITFVAPTQRTFAMTVNWKTVAGSPYVSNDVVTSLVQPLYQDYINSLYVGESISIAVLDKIFLAATADILNPATLSTLTFTVYVNGGLITPSGLLYTTDPEAYYYVSSPSDITVTNI